MWRGFKTKILAQQVLKTQVLNMRGFTVCYTANLRLVALPVFTSRFNSY